MNVYNIIITLSLLLAHKICPSPHKYYACDSGHAVQLYVHKCRRSSEIPAGPFKSIIDSFQKVCSFWFFRSLEQAMDIREIHHGTHAK